MEEQVLSNPVKEAEGVLSYEPWKLSSPVPREMVENDALPLALAGGNAQGVALYQVLNDLGPLASAKSIDVKEPESEIAAAAWAGLPPILSAQSVRTGAPTSLWCKDGQ